MAKSPLFVLIFLTSFCTPTPDAGHEDNKPSRAPNIIVVMADDHGQWASSLYGHNEIKTPSLETLAKAGVTFSNAYAVSPVCSPSRASFFTGRMPSQHGVHDFLSETPEYDHDWLKEEIFINQWLQNAGYYTGLIGKWHATTDSSVPQRGFDYWYSYDVKPGGWSNQYKHRGEVHFSEHGIPDKYDGFQSWNLTDKAIDFMRGSPSDQPFFMFVGYVDTHAPFAGLPDSLVNKYRNGAFIDIPKGGSSIHPPRGEANNIPEDHLEQLAQYYAGVEWMDYQLGRLITYLKSRDDQGNTMIIYTSDHGHLNGHHGLYGKGNATRPQNFFEETINVPLVVSWPEKIKSVDMRVDIPINNCDLFQTIMEIAEVELTQVQKHLINSPGKNFIPFLEDKTEDWTSFKISELGNARMISNEEFKFIRRYAPSPDKYGNELYNLRTDPKETKNAISDHQERANLLTDQLDEFFRLYSEPEHSGTNLDNQFPANGNEQWRKTTAH